MLRTKRLLFVLMVLGLLALMITGATAQEQVTVRWWHIFTNPVEWPEYMTKLAEDYMAANPNVTIEITNLENEAFKERLTTVMQAGDPPDLFQSWGGGILWSYADAGLLRDITPDLDADDGAWRNSFSAPAALNLFSKDGVYYGVPWNFGAVGFWYNKDLFAQAGITEIPETWEEFLAVVQQLKDAGITPIAVGQKDKWPGHFWWVYLAIRTGGQDAFNAAYTREGSFADEPFVRAGSLLQELIALEPFQDGHLGQGYGDEAALMGNGQAAMELMGHWAPGAQRGNSTSGEGIGEALGWFPFPSVPDGMGDPSDVLGGGDGIAVGANAPDEAIDFLKYITSAEAQIGHVEAAGVLPTVAEAEAVVSDPLLKTVLEFRNNAGYYQSYYDQFLPPAIAQAVLDAVDGLFNGTLTAEEAAQMIEDVAAMEL